MSTEGAERCILRAQRFGVFYACLTSNDVKEIKMRIWFSMVLLWLWIISACKFNTGQSSRASICVFFCLFCFLCLSFVH